VEYAGQNGSGVPGLDQMNVRLPISPKNKGAAKLVVTVDGISSNAAMIHFR
jgi:uncharacterized protein (TIGR03437 family)